MDDRERLAHEELIKYLFDVYGQKLDPKLVALITEEGDFEEWTDPLTGYLCRIIRQPYFKSWLGYVRIADTHSKFREDLDDLDNDINVHGGLSYGSDQSPGENKIDVKFCWYGFDCAHCYDLVPYLCPTLPGTTYRTKKYVKDEVLSLAKQLKDLE